MVSSITCKGRTARHVAGNTPMCRCSSAEPRRPRWIPPAAVPTFLPCGESRGRPSPNGSPDVRQRVSAAGRNPAGMRFSLSARPILADTEEKAWQRAEEILARVQRATAGRITPGVPTRPQSEGAWRLLRFAAEGNVHDERLWMPIAAASGASGSTTCLVGTPRAGSGLPAGVLQPRMQRVYHSRVRPAGGCRRLRKGADPPGEGRSRPAPQSSRLRSRLSRLALRNRAI